MIIFLLSQLERELRSNVERIDEIKNMLEGGRVVGTEEIVELKQLSRRVVMASLDRRDDHQNCLIVAFDGCFRLQHRSRCGGEEADALYKPFYFDDVSHGRSIVDLQTAQSNSTCSRFKACNATINQWKAKFNDINGIGGAVCARHGTPLRGSYSDIPLGERWHA